MVAQVSETTRAAVWSELLEAARLSRYYGFLAERHANHARWVKIFLAIAGTGAAAGLLDFTPVWLIEIAGGLAAVLVILDLTHRPSEKAARFSSISERLTHLETASRNLWEDVQSYEIEPNEIKQRLTSLRKEIDNLTAGLSEFTTDEALNERCAELTYKVEQSRYAG